MPTRIQIAKPDIVGHFDGLPKRVFKQADIGQILAEQRGFWRLAQDTTVQGFIRFLTEHSKLRHIALPFPYRAEHRYTWGDVPLLEVLLTVKEQSYFTHYTAVRMHGLTEQVPKTIFINHEQRPHVRGTLTDQSALDRAFKAPARVSNNVIDYGDVRICLINGMFTGQLGVEQKTVTYDSAEPIVVRVTGLERTLIDIAVRPIYAGGVFEVLKAFRLAKEQVSVNRLAAMLEKLAYVYPYHQAIGFYLEHAGYKASAVKLLKRFPIQFNFYLANNLGKSRFVPQWKLFVPEGF